MTKQIGLAVGVLVGLAGCVSVPPQGGFEDVENQVLDRTGLRVRWNQGSPQDEQARQSLKDMLSDELTADEAVQIALLNNRRLQAAYEELGVSQAALVQAGLLSNPIFSANLKPVIGGSGIEAEMTLLQNFMEVFYIPLRKSVEEAHFESTKLRVTAAVIDLAGETLAAFYFVVAQEQVVEMYEQVVQSAAASHDLARRLHEAGNIRELDLANERALYEQSKLDLAAAQLTLTEHREHLNVLMGVWGPDTQWEVARRLPELPAEPIALEQLERRAIANSLDLAITRQEIEAVGRRFGLARKTGLIPFLDLGPAAKHESNGEWLVGPAIALPIPLFDQGQARVAGAQAQLRRRQEEFVAQAVEIRAEVRAVRQRVLTAQRIAGHYRDAMLPLRTKILDETQLEYNAMQVGAFELLVAKQQQINTGRHYVEALRDYWLARTDLDQILRGRLAKVSAGVEPVVMTPLLSGGISDSASPSMLNP